MSTHKYSAFPSNKILKRMGLIADQDGIMRRYIAEDGGWNNHLIQTKSFITDCLSEVQPKSVAILGSGWLLDVPVPFLAEKFSEVYFYDLRHPSNITHKYRKQLGFRFIEMDLTGGLIEQVYQLSNLKEKLSPTELVNQLQLPTLTLPYPVDYVVSINLLSQVDTLIIDYLSTLIRIPNAIIQLLRQAIQQQHIDLLKPGKSCLVSDIEEINLDLNLNIIESKPLIFATIRQSATQKEWIWLFDTKMNYHSNCYTHFKVKAVKF